MFQEESDYELQSPDLDPVSVEKRWEAPDSMSEVSESSDDGSQCKKLNGSLSRVKKSQQRMFLAKQWITHCLLPVSTCVSTVSLEDVEKAYIKDCQKKHQEPLNTFVLARLIHQEFPQAEKCRRGPRGSQKIHYRNLQWRSDYSSNQAAKSASDTEAEGKISSKDLPSFAEAQSSDEKPPPSSVSNEVDKVGVQGPRHASEQMYHAAKELIEKASKQPVPEDEDTDQKGCQDAAKHFTQVVKSIKQEGKFDLLLKLFAHSASCSNSKCHSLCLMFRRVRRHVVNARHPCFVMRVYSVLLKLHVSRCNNTKCGLTACPALQASRQLKRGRDEFQEELQQQEFSGTERLTKRHSSLMKGIRIPSPARSLPDSQPNTPSPPASPSQLPSPRIVPIIPLEAYRVVKPNTEHGGA